MAPAEKFYSEICDRYSAAMSSGDYIAAAGVAKEVRNWLGCRRMSEQILPTGDITGTAGYLVAWAEKRVEMLGRMVDNQNRT